MTTQLEGLTYLLATDDSGKQWVARYTSAEVTEIFGDLEELLRLGHEIRLGRSRRDTVCYRDMVACTRVFASTNP